MNETTEQRLVSLSASAARRVARLAEARGDPTLMLRVTVSGGGCSGFQYGFDFSSSVEENDYVFEKDGTKLVVDGVSLELLNGSEIDFVEDMMGSSFRVSNPNASSACGCGNSFSI